ncbi:hypothetical protein WA577_002063, partial [Blastocystis sp. JDR]
MEGCEAIVTCSFSSLTHNGVSFKAGERVMVLSIDGEYALCRKGDMEDSIPLLFLKVVEDTNFEESEQSGNSERWRLYNTMVDNELKHAVAHKQLRKVTPVEKKAPVKSGAGSELAAVLAKQRMLCADSDDEEDVPAPKPAPVQVNRNTPPRVTPISKPAYSPPAVQSPSRFASQPVSFNSGEMFSRPAGPSRRGPVGAQRKEQPVLQPVEKPVEKPVERSAAASVEQEDTSVTALLQRFNGGAQPVQQRVKPDVQQPTAQQRVQPVQQRVQLVQQPTQPQITQQQMAQLTVQQRARLFAQQRAQQAAQAASQPVSQ